MHNLHQYLELGGMMGRQHGLHLYIHIAKLLLHLLALLLDILDITNAPNEIYPYVDIQLSNCFPSSS